jgi:putative endonuclease
LRAPYFGAKQSKAMFAKCGYVYLLTNKANTVFYTGVTSNLQKRVYEHKQNLVQGFTFKYNVHKLVYYEVFDNIADAIDREKQIKGGSRKKKIGLINNSNPEFRDLYGEL